MIAISKTEKEKIKEVLPHAHVVRTMVHKSKRHRYYCEETGAVLNVLKQIRQNNLCAPKRKGE